MVEKHVSIKLVPLEDGSTDIQMAWAPDTHRAAGYSALSFDNGDLLHIHWEDGLPDDETRDYVNDAIVKATRKEAQ